MNEDDPILFSYFEPMLSKTVDVRKSMMNERGRKFIENVQKDFIKHTSVVKVGYDSDENYETIVTATEKDGHITIDGIFQLPVEGVLNQERETK